MNQAEEWVTMKTAAEMLNIDYDKLSRLVRQKEIKTKSTPLDRRTKLVEINEVRRIFNVA